MMTGNRSAPVLLCIAVLAVLAVLPALSMNAPPARSSQRTAIRPAPGHQPRAATRQFRRDYLEYWEDYEAAVTALMAAPGVRSAVEEDGLDPVEAVRRARTRLTQEPDDSPFWEAQRRASTGSENWREGPRRLLEEAGRAGSAPNCAVCWQADGECPEGPTVDELCILRGVVFAQQKAMELLPTDGLTIAARDVATLAFTAAEVVLSVQECLAEKADECEEEHFRSDVLTNIDEQEVRTIQRDLLAGTLLPDYYLPARDPFHGSLEEVRAVVVKAIQDHAALGLKAWSKIPYEALVQKGDERYAQNDFLGAFRYYRTAYNTLVEGIRIRIPRQ